MADTAVNCVRCRHPHRDDNTACFAPTVKGKDCLCPRLVKPTDGSLASLSQYLKKESLRKGTMPPEEVQAQP